MFPRHFLPIALTALATTQAATLPPPATRPVDFMEDIKPLFEAACIKCHAKGKDKGGFSLESREAFLKGGDTGAGAVVGKSGESLIVELVAGLDPDSVMPKKGTKWTPEQIGLLRAWIDQGALWPPNVSFAKPPPENLKPRAVELAPRPSVSPIDDLVGRYFAEKGVDFPATVDDRTFARRVYLDTIGLLPTPAQLDAFLQDTAPDKRGALVKRLLNDKVGYANHWLTFWNDLLRNDYKGTGFIDGGRKQITGWLYKALIENLRYDRFVAQLVNPTKASEGFTKGIIWRGSVNASMLPPMQAAQNVSQVFMGVNLKCASCHDSFINDWSLADAYGLAAIYADEPLELVHCDKPTGKQAAMRFLYPEVGGIDGKAEKPARLARLAEVLTSKENGRLSRTIVNRLWARLLGRGLVDPLDDMEQPAWSRDLLDWLAEDFVAHGYDLKHTIATICSSATYALPTVEGPREKEEYVFRGPLTRRLTAEQFADALSALSGDWSRLPSSLEFDFGASGLIGELTMPKWIWTSEPWELGPQREAIQTIRPQLEAALNLLAEAETKGADALAKATASVTAAQQALAAATAPREPIAMGTDHVLPESDRHPVIFRKKVALAAVPTEAYGAVLASQRFTVQVNGREAKPIMRDGFRNGRIVLIDLKPLLVAGDNLLVVNVSSHTEKQVNDVERPKYPGATTHLNARPGLAFYARCEMPGGKAIVQIQSDETWRVRRNPEGAWNSLKLSDTAWSTATLLPAGAEPIDEGPSLKPITRRDFANLPVELGPQLSPAVSTAAHVGEIRAALLAADPLQVALDRPNREIVVPQRASTATTIQALELTNGHTLNTRLAASAAKLAAQAAGDPGAWLEEIYRHALSRPPSPAERDLSVELLGKPATAEGITDFLWALVNLPEFQLIN
jgi:mono/diheme cytochrome c family protein